MTRVEDLIEKEGAVPFGVNDWGSCQYTSALNMFNALEKLSSKHGKDEALRKLHVLVSHKGVNTITTSWNEFRKEMLKRATEMEYDKKEMEGLVAWFNKTEPSIDAMFELTRSSAWDLWGAAPYIADLVFKNLEVKTALAPDGPSYETGLYCWLLWKEGLIKGTPEDVFGGYDT